MSTQFFLNTKTGRKSKIPIRYKPVQAASENVIDDTTALAQGKSGRPEGPKDKNKRIDSYEFCVPLSSAVFFHFHEDIKNRSSSCRIF